MKLTPHEITILQTEQILTDISKTSKLIKQWKGEKTKEGKQIDQENLFFHMQTMRLKKFFRQL